MSNYDDDDIEFDFFDEPETVERTPRRRLPRLERARLERGGGDGPPRPPVRIAPGLTPLLRLAGLVALVILVIVFIVRGCSGGGTHSLYAGYMEHVTLLAQQSQQLGRKFTNRVTTPGTSTRKLVTDIRGYAAQAQSQLAEAENIRPPGPLRPEHAHMLDVFTLRASGLARFADALDQTSSSKDASKSAAQLVQQGQLLAASDVDWQYFFYEASKDTLQQQNVTGVVVPHSQFLTTPDIVGADAMVRLFQQLHGPSSSGGVTPGLHGDQLVSTTAQPQGLQLSTTTPHTVKLSTELRFDVVVKNSGDSQELGVPVTLTILGTNIVKRAKIELVSPGQEKTVTFRSFGDIPASLYGPQTKIKVEVAPVPGETNLGNNSATYLVFFSV
jgi:hypothetical protein